MRLKSLTFSFIVITVFLILNSAPIFADVDFRCIPIGGIECPPDDGGGAGGGGGGSSSATSSTGVSMGGSGACSYVDLWNITSNTSAKIIDATPWSPNSVSPQIGDTLGYNITIRNEDYLFSIDAKVRIFALVNGWPYKWESEAKSIGPRETYSFTNSLNWKFNEKPVPMTVTLFYGDRISYVEHRCDNEKGQIDFFVFNETMKREIIILSHPVVNTSVGRPQSFTNSQTETSSLPTDNFSIEQIPTNEQIQKVPTAALITQKPQKKEPRFFAVLSNFIKKLLGGK